MPNKVERGKSKRNPSCLTTVRRHGTHYSLAHFCLGDGEKEEEEEEESIQNGAFVWSLSSMQLH